MHKLITLCVLMGFICPVMEALTPEDQAIKDSLTEKLAEAGSPSDSIPILYDIFDISKRNNRMRLAPHILDVARRAGDLSTQMDMLRHMANFYLYNDSMQTVLIQEAEQLPESDEQKETVAFLKMMHATSQAKYSSDEQRQQRIREILGEMSTINTVDIYEQVVMLHTLCAYLGQETQGELLSQYLDRQAKMLNELPGTFPGIKNILYTQEADLYTNNYDHEKAVKADKKLLEVIDRLQKEYAAKGRKYRHYDTNRYLSYRRLLANYEALTPQEIETYYHRLLDICQNNPDIEADLNNNGRAHIYYLMAHKRYNEALPILKYQTARPASNKTLRRHLIKTLIEAAHGCGDTSTLLDAALEYKDILESYISSKAIEKYKELQIIYDINALKNQNNRLEIEQREAKIKSNKTIIIISLIAIAFLVILLIMMYRLYRKAKLLSHHLIETNQALKAERDTIKSTQMALINARDEAQKANRLKNEFVNNMSHEVKTPLDAIVEYSQLIVDGMDEDKRKYYQRFAQMVTLNSELLHTLVSDVLEISELESPRMKLERIPVSLHSICNMAIGSSRIHLNDGVSMIFTPQPQPDTTIKTDRRRVEQVLINLLNNAAKFTTNGLITLSYILNTDAGTVTFSVTDTGIGIPKGKESIIFERFEKLDSSTQGSGLGLNICRLISQLLKGNISVDTSYRDGARFLFTIPIV